MAIQIKADVMWAQLEQLNDMSGKYQVDLCNLSDAAVAALEKKGIDVKFKDDKQSFITCKSKHPIRAKDVDGADLQGVKIGNGSKAVATISTYSWKFKGKEGISPSLNNFVITELETYEADEDGDIGEAL